MSPSPPGRRALWLVPIVVAICAVMVLPGGTFLLSSSHAGNPMATSAGVTTDAARTGAGSAHPLVSPAYPGSAGSIGPTAISGGLPSPFKSPSLAPPSSTSSLASEISPSILAHAPWAQALLHPSGAIQTPTSLPNLAVLEGQAKAVASASYPGVKVVYPLYTTQPAPLGIADYGLGPTAYSYNTSHVVGSVTFNAPPNNTQPAATNVIQPTPNGERLGAVGSEYEFGLQLNTIGVNLTIPGTNNTDDGVVWAQNVVNWNSTSIHFIEDTWNASYLSYGTLGQNSIYSGCGGNTAWANDILDIYGGILQCSGINIPVTAADYPVTFSIYNNFTVNAQNRAQLVYGYSLWEGGVGTSLSGVADTVVFNNTAGGWQTPSAPPNLPGNTVDPFEPTPSDGLGELQDAEMVIVGGIEGDNAVFTAINGTETLQYSNATSGGWKNVPSAYNFGSETGETSTGLADYWTPAHTLVINQGPAMLYGLWNAAPWASVASGDVQIAGSISPSYGFVFVSNTPPVLNPWLGTEQDNMSWLPTTSTGTFNTYLPRFGSPWTTTYYIQAFAAGSAEYNGTVTASTTALTITLTAAPGTLRAPLYVSTAAQASALAHAVGGSASAPYTFSGLTVDANFTFAHLNDWSFATFELFQAQDVNDVAVNDTYLGSDSAGYGQSYIWDYGLPPFSGLFVPIAYTLTDIPGLTSGINLYYGTDDSVNDQYLFSVPAGLGDPGWQLTLWGDTGTVVNDTLAGFALFGLYEYPGIWIGKSFNTMVTNDATDYFSDGITDMTSTGTTVTNYLAADGSIGFIGIGDTDATLNWFNVTEVFFEGAIGIETGTDYGASALYQSIYYSPGTVGLTVDNLNVTAGSLGGNITLSSDVVFNNLGVWDTFGSSLGAELDADTGVTFNEVLATDTEAVTFWNVTDLTFTNFVTQFAFFGVYGSYGNNVVLSSTDAIGDYGGFILEYCDGITGTNVNSTGNIFAFEEDYATGTVSLTGVNSNDDNVGVNIDWTNGGVTVSDVTVVQTYRLGPNPAGVDFLDSDGGTISGVTASEAAVGARMYASDPGTAGGISTGNTIENVMAIGTGVADAPILDSTIGLWIGSCPGNTATGITATGGGAIGLYSDPTTGGTISNVVATDEAIGAVLYESSWFTVTTVTATNESIGVAVESSSWTWVKTATVSNESVAVYSIDSEYTSVEGVTATNTTLSSPYLPGGNPFGLDAVGAVYLYDDEWDSVSNVAVTTYPVAVALYEVEESGFANVNATGSWFGILGYEVYDSVFSGLGMYQDFIGVSVTYGEYDTFTQSSFVDCTSYGTAFYYADDNYIYDNNFIGNNGAGATYSAAHIQAYTGYGQYNYYYFDGMGNYWSDWTTYTQGGYLAPYPLNDEAWDLYPLGGPVGTFGVWFYEAGLNAGTDWSVTFNGHTQTTGNPWIVFYAMPGTYSFSSGAVAGYTVLPGSGSVTVTNSELEEYLDFTAQYNVSVTETGLPSSTSWSVAVGGVTATGTTSTLNVLSGSGTMAFQVAPVAGYTASPSSGTVTVTNGAYHLWVTFTQVTYTVTVTESGLSGQAWSVTVNGATQSTTGASITLALPNGTYSISVGKVSGYTASSSSVNVTVAGAAAGGSVTFNPNSTTSYVSTDSFNTWLAIAIAVAVIALVLGLLALFLRRNKGNPPPSGAQPWTPPASGGGTEGGAAGSSNWSEGPASGSGGNPPSS